MSIVSETTELEYQRPRLVNIVIISAALLIYGACAVVGTLTISQMFLNHETQEKQLELFTHDRLN